MDKKVDRKIRILAVWYVLLAGLENVETQRRGFCFVAATKTFKFGQVQHSLWRTNSCGFQLFYRDRLLFSCRIRVHTVVRGGKHKRCGFTNTHLHNGRYTKGWGVPSGWIKRWSCFYCCCCCCCRAWVSSRVSVSHRSYVFRADLWQNERSMVR